MAYTDTRVLHETVWQGEGAALWLKRAVLLALGVAVLALTAKINIPVPGSPVPVTLTTFAVLSIGAGYGARLGFATVLGYLLIGAAGYDVFAGSSAEANGLTYMMGGTGGYLAGYLMATLALGWAARAGWDRSVMRMAGAMLIGNALIYVPGILWLGVLYGWDKPLLDWGLTPFLVGDAVKLALAALIFPAIWKLAGRARG